MARFGILTGGGDCPGLNAVIRGVVRAGVNRYGHHIIGFRYGWAGVLEANTVELTPQNTAGILHRGGTILGTSRTNPYRDGADGTALVREVPRIVPPRCRMPEVFCGVSSTVLASSTPAQP